MTDKQKRLLVFAVGIAVEIGVIYAFDKEAKKNHKSFGGKMLYWGAGALTGAAISGMLVKASGIKI